jgi:predicted DNA-binding ribbon-helix-helix protein
MRKKSLILSGHATSIKLEDPFWDSLEEIADLKKLSLKAFIEYEDCHRKEVNLASHLRVLVLNYYKNKI